MKQTIFYLLLLFTQLLLAQMPVKQAQKWGFMGQNAKMLISPQYEDVTLFSKNIAGVKDKGKWGLINHSGQWLATARHENITLSEQGAVLFANDSSFIFDINGNMLFAKDYNVVWRTDKAICFEGQNADVFLTDVSGKRLKDIYFQATQKPSENKIAMQVENNKWSYFYETGNLAFKGTFHETKPFHEGLAAVANEGEYNAGLWGFINSQGEQVIDFQFEKAFSFSQGLALVKKNGMYGYIDKTGKTIIPFEYLEGKDFHANFARVQKTDKWTYIDVKGNEFSEKYDYVLDFSENIGLIFKQNKWGAVNEQGKMVIPCMYDRIYPFKEGFAAAMKDGKMGYLNKNGEVALPFEYDLCDDFEKGQAIVRKNGLYGTINTSGIAQIPFSFEEIDIQNGTLTQIEIQERWGYIDAEGNTQIPFIYEAISPFYNGRARAMFNGKYGFIDKKGHLVIPAIYTEASDFKEGYAYIKVEIAQPNGEGAASRYNFIDTTGTRLTDKLYLSGQPFFENGMTVVEKESGAWLLTNKGKEIRMPIQYDIVFPYKSEAAIVKLTRKYGLIDKQAKEILPCEYDYVGDFAEGFFRVFVGEIPDEEDDVRLKPQTFRGKWGFVDAKGELLIKPDYQYVTPFQNGFAKVQKEGKWGMIDNTGKLVVPCSYKQLLNVAEGLARFKENRKFGAVNPVGRVIIPPNYSELWEPREGLIVAAFNEKYGFLDLNGKTAIPFDYEEVLYFSEGKAAVMKQGKWGFIDKAGKEIIAFKYDEVTPFNNGIAKVSIAQKYGCINEKGLEIIPIIYTDISPFYQGVAKVNKDNYFQLINDKGKGLTQWAIDYETSRNSENVLTMHEGLVGAKTATHSGYENEKQEEIIPVIYERVDNFESNTILVNDKGYSFIIDSKGRYLTNPNIYENYSYPIKKDSFILKANQLFYLVGRNGQRLLQEGFESPLVFSEGYAAAKKNGKFGYINSKGEWLIAPQYDWATDFVNGKARVFEAEDKSVKISATSLDMLQEGDANDIYPILNVKGKWGMIDKQNHLIIPMKYELLEDFKNPFARVMLGGNWSYIDAQGKLLTDSIEYQSAYPFFHNIGILADETGMGAINHKGKWIVPLKYTNVAPQLGGIIMCQDELNNYFYFDNQGKALFNDKIQQDYLYAGYQNVFLFKKDNFWAITDTNGKLKSDFEFEDYELYEKGNTVYLKVVKNKKLGIIDANAQEILPIQYDNVAQAYRDIFIVVQNRKYALYNVAKRQFLCNFEFDAIARVEDGKFYAYKNGKLWYLNDDGKCIEGCE